MTELKIVKQKEYDKYVINHKQSHFMQSFAWGEVSNKRGKKTYTLGLYIDDVMQGACLLLETKLPLGYSYMYCPRGFIIDYSNKELLKIMTSEIKKFGKSKKTIYIRIDPCCIYNIKNKELAVNTKELNNLIDLGYRHFGFNLGFEASEPRYTYKIDLTPSLDEIKSKMHASTRKILNRNNPYELEVKIGDESDLEDFTKLMSITEKRDGFIALNYKNYKDFYETLNNYKISDIYTLRIDFNKLLENRNNLLNEKSNNLLKQVKETKKKEIEIQINKIKEEITEYENMKLEYENNILISSIITVKYGDTLWTIHGGNHDILKKLGANYEVYYKILKDAKEEGYKYLDMFGTDGYDKNDGIHLFKKRFGGDYIEYIGQFDLILKPFLNKVFNTLIYRYRKYRNKKR